MALAVFQTVFQTLEIYIPQPYKNSSNKPPKLPGPSVGQISFAGDATKQGNARARVGTSLAAGAFWKALLKPEQTLQVGQREPAAPKPPVQHPTQLLCPPGRDPSVTSSFWFGAELVHLDRFAPSLWAGSPKLCWGRSSPGTLVQEPGQRGGVRAANWEKGTLFFGENVSLALQYEQLAPPPLLPAVAGPFHRERSNATTRK